MEAIESHSISIIILGIVIIIYEYLIFKINRRIEKLEKQQISGDQEKKKTLRNACY